MPFGMFALFALVAGFGISVIRIVTVEKFALHSSKLSYSSINIANKQNEE